MTFKTAKIKLTLWYLLIVVFISIMFSTVIYQVAFREINIFNTRQSSELRRTPSPARALSTIFDIDEFEKNRASQLQELKDHMIRNLVLTNLIILILAGLASYNFAKRTLKPIEDMVEKQNRFTADASHEFRTPLAAMKLETEVALRDKNFNFTDAKNLLQSNLEEIAKLESLSNGLLDLAQYTDYKMKSSNSEPISETLVSAVIDDVAGRFRVISEKKNIKISVHSDQSRAKIDEDQLSKLVSIMLDNAIKYSPNESTIKINSEKEQYHIVIKIADRGIGIKEEELDRIFDRFYRSELSRSKNKFGGFGLGLAIAKRIIESNHGQILVESYIDHGTTFTIKLPLS